MAFAIILRGTFHIPIGLIQGHGKTFNPLGLTINYSCSAWRSAVTRNTLIWAEISCMYIVYGWWGGWSCITVPVGGRL